MIIDKFLQVSAAQAVTASGTSTDTINFSQASPNVGLHCQQLYMVVTVDASVAAAGAATVTFVIQDSDNNSSFSGVAVSATFSKDTLVAGYQVVIPMPAIHRQYVRLYYTIASGPLTAGAFSAHIVAGVQANTPLPDAL